MLLIIVVGEVRSSRINAREELSVSHNGIVVKTGVMAGAGAGLPAAWPIALVAAGHSRHMSPALDVVEIAGAVPAPGVEAGVGEDGGPETRGHFYPCGRASQVSWQCLARQRFQTAHHLHRDAPVVHVEHPRVLDAVHVPLETVELQARLGEVRVGLAARLEMMEILAGKLDVHINVPGDEVGQLDGPQAGPGLQLVVDAEPGCRLV